MIKNIHIENFKSIQNQDIELRELNVLIGQNGAGKSNFISLFKFLERLSEQQLSTYMFLSGGIEAFLFGGFEKSSHLRIKLEFGSSVYESNIYDFSIEGSADIYRFENEIKGFWNKLEYPKQPYTNNIGSNKQEAQLKTLANNKDNICRYIYDYMKSWKVYHFHDTSENSRMKQLQDIDDNIVLKNEGDNIASFLYFLKNNYYKHYTNIVENVRLVYPIFHDFYLEESRNAKGKIMLMWTEKGSDHVYMPRQISDGTLRFICLATLLSQPSDLINSPRTIVLDEPELGLHPFAIHVLSELIKKVSIRKQIILATQSITLINHFVPEDLLITERTKDGKTEFNRKTNEEFESWLEDYTLGQLWESNFMGGRP